MRELQPELDKLKKIYSSINVIKIADFVNAYKAEDTQKIDLMSSELTPDEQAIVSIEGARTISRIYPGIEEEIELQPGDYVMDYMIKSQMKILPSFTEGDIEISYQEGGGVYEGQWIIGSGTVPFSLTRADLDGKEHITFMVVSIKRGGEYGAVDEFRDNIFNEDGDIELELLYEGEKLTAVSGMISRDFTAGDNERVEYLNISKEDVSYYLKPRLR